MLSSRNLLLPTKIEPIRVAFFSELARLPDSEPGVVSIQKGKEIPRIFL